MKNFIVLFFSLFLVVSCKISEEPEFVKMENIFPKKVSMMAITLTSDAVFNNPNDVGCELIATDISVLVNGKEVGKAKQTQAIAIANNGPFSIPLEISFSPAKILENKKDVLKGALGNILENKIEVAYKGNVTLKKAGVSFTSPVDVVDEISLKK